MIYITILDTRHARRPVLLITKRWRITKRRAIIRGTGDALTETRDGRTFTRISAKLYTASRDQRDYSTYETALTAVYRAAERAETHGGKFQSYRRS